MLDSSLTPDIYMKGLRPDGYLVINTKKGVDEVRKSIEEAGFKPPAHVAVVDATEIALRNLKAPIVNTAMLGALVRTVQLVSLDTLLKIVYRRFADRSASLAEANVNAVREAYNETRVG